MRVKHKRYNPIGGNSSRMAGARNKGGQKTIFCEAIRFTPRVHKLQEFTRIQQTAHNSVAYHAHLPLNLAQDATFSASPAKPPQICRLAYNARQELSLKKNMSLTIDELNAGISYWRTTRWPQDFHNAFYCDMARANPNGTFTPKWWDGFLPILSGWRALRPRSQVFVTNRATQKFAELSQVWKKAIEDVFTSDIATIPWGNIAPFATLVGTIKNVESPVFTSKFCHFLAPHIFPVVDNAAMDNPFRTYENYYLTGQSQWKATNDAVQQELVKTLTWAINPKPIENYPMKCKIIELCLIGRNQKKVQEKSPDKRG